MELETGSFLEIFPGTLADNSQVGVLLGGRGDPHPHTSQGSGTNLLAPPVVDAISEHSSTVKEIFAGGVASRVNKIVFSLCRSPPGGN